MDENAPNGGQNNVNPAGIPSPNALSGIIISPATLAEISTTLVGMVQRVDAVVETGLSAIVTNMEEMERIRAERARFEAEPVASATNEPPKKTRKKKTPGEKAFLKAIRDHARECLGVTATSKVIDWPVPALRDVLAVNNGYSTTEAPSSVPFIIDWDSHDEAPARTEWTVRCAVLFADSFWNAYEENRYQVDIPRRNNAAERTKAIKEAFIVWVIGQKRARHLSISQHEGRNRESRRAARKDTLFERRLKFIQWAEGTTPELIRTFEMLGKDAMSEDESEPVPEGRPAGTLRGRTFKVCPSTNRATVITNLVRVIDKSTSQAGTLYVNDGRKRVVGEQGVATTNLSSGFPEGTYNPTWLSAQDAYTKRIIGEKYYGRKLDLDAMQAFTQTLEARVMDTSS